MKKLVFAGLILAAGLSQSLQAQTAPVIVAAYAKETVLNGTAALNTGPITVYNTTFPARAKVGVAQQGRDGKFALSLKTALVQGHRYIAIDRSGRTSAVFTVPAPRNVGNVPALPPR